MWCERRFISFDKTPIFYRQFTPESQVKATLILTHGIGEHSGRYKHVAEFLGVLGIECLAYDLRGFGQSGGRRSFVKHFTDFHQDLKAVHSLTTKSRPGTPVILLGHSFGGLVTSSYLAFTKPPKVSGLILSSPLFGVAIEFPAWRQTMAILLSYLCPYYTESTRVLPQMLTHDRDILHRDAKDPLIYQKMSVGLYREMCWAIAQKKLIAERIETPTLILQSENDQIVSVEETKNFYNLLKSEDKSLEIYPQYLHEVLNEVGREKVLSDASLWITRHLIS